MSPPERDLLIEIRTDVKFLRESHERVTEKVEKLEKEAVTKSGLAGWLTVFFLGLAGLGEALGVYRKG